MQNFFTPCALLIISVFFKIVELVRLDELCPDYSQNTEKDAKRVLIYNRKYDGSWRSSDDLQLIPSHISKIGFSNCRMSGSGQFPLPLPQPFKQLDSKPKVMFVDLRLEAHGYVDELAVSFFCPKNWDLLERNACSVKDMNDLMTEEMRDFESLNPKNVTIYENIQDTLTKKDTIAATEIRTEADVIRDLGFEYQRIAIVDHRAPTACQVDAILKLFEAQHGSWLHFHCKAGKGRTTTAMIMRDMYLNADIVPLTQILQRNYAIGPTNLSDLTRYKGTYKFSFAQERVDFLHAFYEYCRDRILKGVTLTWSEYLEAKNSNCPLMKTTKYFFQSLFDYIPTPLIKRFLQL